MLYVREEGAMYIAYIMYIMVHGSMMRIKRRSRKTFFLNYSILECIDNLKLMQKVGVTGSLRAVRSIFSQQERYILRNGSF